MLSEGGSPSPTKWKRPETFSIYRKTLFVLPFRLGLGFESERCMVKEKFPTDRNGPDVHGRYCESPVVNGRDSTFCVEGSSAVRYGQAKMTTLSVVSPREVLHLITV